MLRQTRGSGCAGAQGERRAAPATAAPTAASSDAASKGLARKVSPRVAASGADSPRCPEMSRTGVPGRAARTRSASWLPLIPGMPTSVTRSATGPDSSASVRNASSPLAAARTR